MGMEFLAIAIVLLALTAIFDLTVGVSNDAANFLNSSIGARVAPLKVILAVATLGILAGVTFSSGMMEVARKGIFQPGMFTMPELLIIFLAVMLTDILLLDMFNTNGMPTSTTVSIVFELLGAAVAVSTFKILHDNASLTLLSEYINTGKAMAILGAILLSVVVAFFSGAIVQFLTRLVFTFDYQSRIRRFGAIWGGIALSSITYFILVKGARGASFITEERAAWISSHTFLILFAIFAVSAVVFQVLLWLRFNILKPIVLVGTFALAMAFAANDLVNFIGVPMAGYHAYNTAVSTAAAEGVDPLTVGMGALAKKVPTETHLLLLAGLVMAATLWFSRKARTVSQTEIGLAQQGESEERFDSTWLSRSVVRMAINVSDVVLRLVPKPVRAIIARRFDARTSRAVSLDGEARPSFDMLRASVNLMVAGAVIAYATSYKLPLSTTYVTFMVAMGTSFADRAWGRETAVYRVTGVLTVIGGWFLTAVSAFLVSGVFAIVIFHGGHLGIGYYGNALAVVLLFILGGSLMVSNHRVHRERSALREIEKVFNLQKVTDLSEAVAVTFEHTAILLGEVRQSVNNTLEGLFTQDIYMLNQSKVKSRQVDRWSNIIIANAFKAMRLMQQQLKRRERGEVSGKYSQTFRRLQKISDGHRDLVDHAYRHVSNHHKGMLPEQIEELREVLSHLNEMFDIVEAAMQNNAHTDLEQVVAKQKAMKALTSRLQVDQMARIANDESKTRLSILYFAVLGNVMMLATQNMRLLEIYSDSFGDVPRGQKEISPDLDLD